MKSPCHKGEGERNKALKTAKSNTSLSRNPIATAPTTRKHNSMGKLYQSSSNSRLRKAADSNLSGVFKKEAADSTHRQVTRNSSRQQLKLESRRTSINSSGKAKTKRLTLKDRDAHIQIQPLNKEQEFRQLANRIDSANTSKFDKMARSLLKNGKSVEALHELCQSLQTRLQKERNFSSKRTKQLEELLRGKQVEASAFELQKKFLREQLAFLRYRVSQLSTKNDTTKERPSSKSSSVQTSESVSSEQYKDYIAHLDRKLDETKQKRIIYEKMLSVAEAEHGVDLNALYERAIEVNQSVISEQLPEVARRKKIRVDVDNDSSAHADISIVNDSDEPSFNFIGRSEGDFEFHESLRKKKQQKESKGAQSSLNQVVRLNFQLLNRQNSSEPSD